MLEQEKLVLRPPFEFEVEPIHVTVPIVPVPQPAPQVEQPVVQTPQPIIQVAQHTEEEPTMGKLERFRRDVMVADGVGSILFAAYQIAVLSGWLHQTNGCTVGQCMADAFIVNYVCFLYLTLAVAGVIARMPTEALWEMILTFASIVPLGVTIVFAFFYSSKMNGFQWYAFVSMLLTELVDVFGFVMLMLLLTRRGYFGVVDAGPPAAGGGHH